jgi:hypothetical protein
MRTRRNRWLALVAMLTASGLPLAYATPTRTLVASTTQLRPRALAA